MSGEDIWETAVPMAAGAFLGRALSRRKGFIRHPEDGREIPTLGQHMHDTTRDFKAELGHKPSREDLRIMEEQYHEFYNIPKSSTVARSVGMPVAGAAAGAGGEEFRKRK